MNKTELIEKIAAGSGLKKAEAKDALDATLRELKNALVAGEKVQLVGFGTFEVKERAALKADEAARLDGYAGEVTLSARSGAKLMLASAKAI